VQETPRDQPASAARPPASRSRPLLIYDGDCAFCAYWARYWQKLTGDRVDYQPYQEVAADFPGISQAEFQRAVQYVAPDGRRASAAEASFLTLSHAPGKAFWLTVYRHVPGFAWVAERTYAFIAAYRSAFYRLTLLLWGKNYAPPRYELVSFLFLRLLGLIYFSAFVSFAVQAQGLIGSHGILPVADFIDAVAARYGPERFYLAPMLFWINDSDAAIHIVIWAGAAISLLLIANVLTRISLALLFVLYLSLFYAGQVFMSYQWDLFLLETGFAALILSIATMPGIWLLRWLLFRFMFMSGVVKLLSGDLSWWNLTALDFHFLTQPLPTPLAWYADRLPEGLLTFATAAMFVVELAMPFLIFAPRRLRFLAAFAFLLLEGLILITGNYNWFNFQTMLLCLPLFDDAAVRQILPARLAAMAPQPLAPRPGVRAFVGVIVVLIVVCSLVRMDLRFGGAPPGVARTIDGWLGPFNVVSGYGLFAIMTTNRREIVIEGSYDGRE
jgi:predicted DCC family thiol-disulfide oxidoreductase YuxK